MNLLQLISHYYHTLRYLRVGQIWGRLIFRARSPHPDTRTAPQTREMLTEWCVPVMRRQSQLSETLFLFLNEKHEIVTADSWNDPRLSFLWLYNLHYFDDLNADNAGQRHASQFELINRWIAENPPGVGIGWEPYPISLRVVNWIKWTLSGNEPMGELLHSLAIQLRFLTKRLEVHLLGNHLLANAKALLFGGLFFEGAEADHWFKTGLDIMNIQLEEQILSDGGHFERSPMYHSLIAEDMLDLVNIFKTFEKPMSGDWREAIKKMLNWLFVMTHPDGEIAFFNDASLGIAPRLKDLIEYARRLKIECPRLFPLKSEFLAESGYVRMVQGRMTLFVDVGRIGPDYLPGHAHADTLSFELSVDDKRVLVNSGTSLYGNGGERQRQRGTAAHNTIRLDNLDSSEVWGGFRVARRANVYDIRFKDMALSATHNGYERLPGKPLHHRKWTCANNTIEITDEISGKGAHLVEIFLHFHPDFTPHLDGSLVCSVYNLIGVRALKIQLDSGFAWKVVPSTWHPQFGMTVPNFKLVGTYSGILPVRLVTRIS